MFCLGSWKEYESHNLLPLSSFTKKLLCVPILIWYPSMIQIRKVASFIGWANWAIKQITTCKDSKNTVRIQPCPFSQIKLCYVDKIKILSTDKSFSFAVTLGPKIPETIIGKLSFGAKVLQAGGIDKVFREYFAVEKMRNCWRLSSAIFQPQLVQ